MPRDVSRNYIEVLVGSKSQRVIPPFTYLQTRVHQYQTQISKLQLENESMRGQLRGLEAACAGEVHAALVARLATLETEHAALARDADAQRRQYERCLDDVANQVVRALLSQKVHRYALVTTRPPSCLFSLIVCSLVSLDHAPSECILLGFIENIYIFFLFINFLSLNVGKVIS